MNCTASQVLAAADSFCGLSVPQLKAAQLQLAADALLVLTPTADVTHEAIMQRARAAGVCCLTRLQLRSVILQQLCTINELYT